MATITSQAQYRTIDSLKSLLALPERKDDFKVLWGLAYELFDVDNAQALEYANRAHKVALSNNDSLNIVKSGRIEGQLLRRFDRLDESLKVLTYVLPIAQRNQFTTELEYIFNGLAIVHSLKMEFDKALDWHFQSLALREKQGDGKKISTTLLNIGYLYSMIESFNDAKYYYLKSLETKEKIHDSYDLDRLLINIGICYASTGETDTARSYYSRALEICKPNCSNQIILECEIGKGYSLLLDKKFDQAKIHLLRGLTLAKQEKSLLFQIQALQVLSSISLARNNMDQLHSYLTEMEFLSELNQYPEQLLEFYRLKSEYYLRLSNFRSASAFQKKYSDLRNVTFGRELNMNLARIQTKFAEKDNLERIKAQAKNLEQQKDSIKQKEKLMFAFATIAFLTICLAISLYKSNQTKKSVNKILDQKIRERTIELERNRDDLLRAHDEKDLILKKISSELLSSLATMRGLSGSGLLEVSEGREKYFREAELIERKIDNHVNKNQFKPMHS